ncbi:hypothetical protein [Serratia microhaemolytica]|uniref:hypothetical protein n=1 Tax=Serratia microhaemolytica TaxID=2675110 RepID=UPI000FDEF796|nr:hypothetical protein [Serratia microhaemolytica]
MSRFILTRGWIECDFEQVRKIKESNVSFAKNSNKYSLSLEMTELYKKCWHYPSEEINWISIISFGANINGVAIYYIKDMVSEICAKEKVDGYFRIDDEEEQSYTEWFITDGNLIEKTNNKN